MVVELQACEIVTHIGYFQEDNFQPCLWQQKADIFDGESGHLQPHLWQQKQVFEAKINK